MALRWDGETMKNGSFSGLSGGNVACTRPAETEREDMGRGVCAGREQEIPCPSVREISGGDSLSGERVGTSEGVTQSDRAGNTFAERLRAAATGLYAAAERMGERLRGIAEDVFAYATGQRDAERAGHAVESAGAALERADRTLEQLYSENWR